MSDATALRLPGIRPEQALRRANGTFRKGVSGNPSGRPRIVADLQTAARALAPDALSVLAEIMANERSPAAARVAAANAILDRGFGRPSTAVIIQAPTPSPEEEQRRREIMQDIRRSMEAGARRVHELEQRAIAAERRLAGLLPNGASGEDDPVAWSVERGERIEPDREFVALREEPAVDGERQRLSSGRHGSGAVNP